LQTAPPEWVAYRFELQRIADEWRIATLRSTPVWTVNRPTS
jgi:hypothetical protein